MIPFTPHLNHLGDQEAGSQSDSQSRSRTDQTSVLIRSPWGLCFPAEARRRCRWVKCVAGQREPLRDVQSPLAGNLGEETPFVSRPVLLGTGKHLTPSWMTFPRSAYYERILTNSVTLPFLKYDLWLNCNRKKIMKSAQPRPYP